MFSICDTIEDNIKLIAKYLYVFDDDKGLNVFIVTNEDLCYGKGSNYRGCLGLGHNLPVHDMTERIHELSHQNVCKFFHGMDFALALTTDHLVNSWGQNYQCELGRQVSSTVSQHTPNRISALNDKRVVDISCGCSHSLALTADGLVYGWGDNREGQVGCGGDHQFIRSPVKMELNTNKIKAIYCSKTSSFAVTVDGLVFSWGDNEKYQIGHNAPKVCQPRLVHNLCGIKTVCPSAKATHFLTNEGLVYYCGENPWFIQKVPMLMMTDKRFQDLGLIVSYCRSESVPTAFDGYKVRDTGHHHQYLSNKTVLQMKLDYMTKLGPKCYELTTSVFSERKGTVSKDSTDGLYRANYKIIDVNESIEKSRKESTDSQNLGSDENNKTSINEIVDTLSGNESSIDEKIQKLYEECRDDRKNETIDGKDGNNERKNQCKSPVTVRQMAIQYMTRTTNNANKS
ncbi:unnamed protein product [Oppiella nova]|uniref:Uncharacterized protein n=1 Tax=Oppiella nova TaxID=334625 RepID=A0A7R9M3N0_9ACAR|nr:unnamed protein product [Oppiella nova]CAG2170153.1 unnamed protein product [Oppiella nova]